MIPSLTFVEHCHAIRFCKLKNFSRHFKIMIAVPFWFSFSLPLRFLWSYRLDSITLLLLLLQSIHLLVWTVLGHELVYVSRRFEFLLISKILANFVNIKESLIILKELIKNIYKLIQIYSNFEIKNNFYFDGLQ